MDTFEAIEKRRSIKLFDSEETISEESIKKIFSATLLSPTSFNMQHWRFVLVNDPEIRKKIRQASFDQPKVTDASLLVIICADTNAWKKEPERYWRNASEEERANLLPMIKGFYDGNNQLQRDEAIRSCGIAAQTLMLSAKSLGYDTAPMIGFDPVAVGNLIRLPDDHLIAMMICIGKPKEPALPRGGQLPYDEVVIKNSF